MLQDAANEYEFILVRNDGEKEAVKYRLPSLRGMSDYLTLQSDDVKLLVWLCEFENESEVDKYDMESIFALLEEVKGRMDPKLAAWLSRQAAKREKLKELFADLSETSGKESQQTSTSKPDEDLSRFSISPRPNASES